MIYFECGAQSLITDTIEFRDKLDSLNFRNEKFKTLYCYNKFPSFIKNSLKKINGTKFKIANSDEKFNSTDINVNPKLANRQLIYACISENYFVFTYFKRIGISMGRRSVIIKFSKEKNIKWIASFISPTNNGIDELIEFAESKKIPFFLQVNI